ncbi:MAG: valine--tRNA ligase, partial [bacterium]|nr:valine--tRNA ligase [bacterium]
MDKRYNPQEIEEKIYSLWEKSGFFNPDTPQINADSNADKRRKNPRKSAPHLRTSAFSIVMPPPNANGALHIGHALFVTLQDIMIRFNRMRGKKALWLPGADHAGFETQSVFDKKLEKEGRNRFQIPREELYKEMYAFSMENKKIMENQLRRLGASCDWSREKFTLDPDIVKEVQNTFIKMHKDGLIYRGLRTVNWCVKHQTALSGLEVKRKEEKGKLYYMKYGPFTLATARPETKFGDTAIAVHPSDKRYKKYVGKEVEIEGLLGKFKIKVIADTAVDPNFGTGVIKVTPAHDLTDSEIGARHNLEVKQVIDRYGKLNHLAGPYAGMKVAEAREKIVEDLKKKGLLVKVDENYTHNLAVCYKCERTLEPIPLPQWYVTMKPLAKPAIEAIQKEKIKILPERQKKVLLHWLKNIEDWNVSRQIVWGIRIPAWFCANATDNLQLTTYNSKQCAPVVLIKKPAKCPHCENQNLTQDPDVFDTWFSSGQWPYLTLGFKDKGKHDKDFKEFYPTSVMETGSDILFFWVARMLMLGIYRTGIVPFKTVYLHGLVRDKDRQKMSKSRGNVIDPLGVAAEYGTDAVRAALVAGNTPGRDSAISED